MICYYHNDLDGRCAAAIVLNRYPDCRMREIDYKEDPDFSKEIGIEETVYIVDFSFKPEKMKALLAHKRKDIHWIDHHKTAIDYNYNVMGSRDFSEPGKSGCELTWEYLHPTEPVLEAIKLIGDRDTWAWKYGSRTKLFTAGMLAKDTRPESNLMQKLVSDRLFLIEEVIGIGDVVISQKEKYATACRKSLGYKTVFEGHSVYVVNLPFASSESFGEFYELYLCASVSWDGDQWTVSLRVKNTENIDVSEIAKKYGGGGHKGAAGFNCKELPF